MNPTILLAGAIIKFLYIYMALLGIRILLRWFPNVNWMDPPFSILSQLTDPYLNLFRSFIPPLGGIDFSPTLGFFLLYLVVGALQTLMVYGGIPRGVL